MSVQKIIKTGIKYKIVITIVLFVIYISFIDKNSLISQFQQKSEIEELTGEKHFFEKKIEKNTKRLEQLKTNDANLEKFAREQYRMHKANEEVYIISEQN